MKDINIILSYLGPCVKKWNVMEYDKEYENSTNSNISSISTNSTNKNKNGYYYQIYSCFKLMEEYEKEQSISYDTVIKTRFDLLCKKKLTLETGNYLYTTISPTTDSNVIVYSNKHNMKIYSEFLFSSSQLNEYLESNNIPIQSIGNSKLGEYQGETVDYLILRCDNIRCKYSSHNIYHNTMHQYHFDIQ